tara:strand:- start:2191 stop:2439 length:249 start_codon:yes stop_codon:yes gene_type:complete
MEVGGYKIVFQAEAPDPRRIPPNDILGVTVILLSCCYNEKEFIRVRSRSRTMHIRTHARTAPPGSFSLSPAWHACLHRWGIM